MAIEVKNMQDKEVVDFKKNIACLISNDRLQSYDNDIIKHSQNLHLIAKITPKIALLEIVLRNILDFKLGKSAKDWIINAKHTSIIEAKQSVDSRYSGAKLSHYQYLSRFSLGNVITIIEELHFYPLFFEFADINFKDFHHSNRNFGFIGKKKVNLSKIDKVDIALHLLWTLRNRSFHWENLYKMRQAKNGKVFPRLNYKLKNTIIALEGNKIESFLSFLLDCINKDLIKTL